DAGAGFGSARHALLLEVRRRRLGLTLRVAQSRRALHTFGNSARGLSGLPGAAPRGNRLMNHWTAAEATDDLSEVAEFFWLADPSPTGRFDVVFALSPARPRIEIHGAVT